MRGVPAAARTAISTGVGPYRELAAICNHLTGLALQGADVSTVTAILAKRIDAAVAVLDSNHRTSALASPNGCASLPVGWPDCDPRLQPMLLSISQTRRAVRLARATDWPPVVGAPVAVGDEIVAYVLTVTSDLQNLVRDVDLLITEHAATVYAVLMARERAAADAAGQLRDDLIDSLLAGGLSTVEEKQRLAAHLGYHNELSYRCLVIPVITNRAGTLNPVSEEARLATRRRMYESVRRLLSVHAPRAIIAMRRDEILVLAVENDGEPFHQGARNLANMLVGRLRTSFPHSIPVVGIGGVCQRLDDIARSYEQARHAARAASSLGRADRAVGFEELGILRLLLQVPELRELNRFADEVFGRLLEYDRQKRAGLLLTLSAYLRSNGSLQAAGKRLHLHPNSIAYRLGRIRDLIGLDLDRYEDRLLVQVALAIVESLEPEMLSGGGQR